MQRMYVKPLTQFPRQVTHERVDASNIDGGYGIGHRFGAEKRRHQGQAIKFASKIERGTVLPTVPDGPHRYNHLAQLLRRGFPLDPKASLIVTFDLGPEPQNKPTVRVRL